MRELVQAFMDVSKDIKKLIDELKELNTHLNTFEEITDIFKDLNTELQETNQNIGDFLNLFKEMSTR